MTNIKAPIIAVMALLSLLTVSGPASAQAVAGEEHCVVNVKSTDVLNVRFTGNASSRIVTKENPHERCSIHRA